MSPDVGDDWVTVGVILRPHALGGAVLVKPLTSSVEGFMEAPLAEVTIRLRDRSLRVLHIDRRAIHQDMVMVNFREIKDRTGAESILKAEILIPESERWELPEGSYYQDDLIGLNLISADSGEPIATVTKVQEGAAHDYLVFPNPKDSRQPVLLPIVPEMVIDVDLKARQIRVHIPEGLLDLP